MATPSDCDFARPHSGRQFSNAVGVSSKSNLRAHLWLKETELGGGEECATGSWKSANKSSRRCSSATAAGLGGKGSKLGRTTSGADQLPLQLEPQNRFAAFAVRTMQLVAASKLEPPPPHLSAPSPSVLAVESTPVRPKSAPGPARGR